MKKISLALLTVAAALMMAGCVFTRPVAVSSNAVGSKVGQSEAKLLFNILPLGNSDAGAYKAAKSGGITKISTVDVKTNFWFFGTTVTTIVSGE